MKTQHSLLWHLHFGRERNIWNIAQHHSVHIYSFNYGCTEKGESDLCRMISFRLNVQY